VTIDSEAGRLLIGERYITWWCPWRCISPPAAMPQDFFDCHRLVSLDKRDRLVSMPNHHRSPTVGALERIDTSTSSVHRLIKTFYQSRPWFDRLTTGVIRHLRKYISSRLGRVKTHCPCGTGAETLRPFDAGDEGRCRVMRNNIIFRSVVILIIRSLPSRLCVGQCNGSRVFPSTRITCRDSV
jgi:hypothetical protein